MLKTSYFALGFQHFPRDLANVNEWKIMFDLSINWCSELSRGATLAILSIIFFYHFLIVVALFDLVHNVKSMFQLLRASDFLYPPQTVFVGGYTVFTLSDQPSDRQCVRNVLFP